MAGNAEEREAYGPEYANYMIDLQGTLEALHLSGLSVQIAWNGRGAIELKLGHASTGNVATSCSAHEIFTVVEAVLWLRDEACRHFPDSRFAAKYRNRTERPGAINTPGTQWARSCGCTCPVEQPRTVNDRCIIDPRCPAHGFI